MQINYTTKECRDVEQISLLFLFLWHKYPFPSPFTLWIRGNRSQNLYARHISNEGFIAAYIKNANVPKSDCLLHKKVTDFLFCRDRKIPNLITVLPLLVPLKSS